MKKYFLSLITLLIITTCAIAAPEAKFLKMSKEYTFHPDGSYEVRHYKELVIESHVALNSLYGETFIVYNPKFQEIKFNSSYTKQADGNIITTPTNAFNEVLPSAASNAPAYNHLQEMVVTHTGLEIGATIFLDYTVLTRPGYLPAGMKPETDDILQEKSPIQEYTIKINVPSSFPFHYILSGSKIKPTTTQHGDMKQYSWQFKNIPPFAHEPNIPSHQAHMPRLTTCCYDSQASVLNLLYNIYTSNTDEAVKTIVNKIITNKNKELDKIIAIQKYVATQIAFCSLNQKECGYSARTPAEVLQTSYGTPVEKSRLLLAMLQSIGQNPEIVVLYPLEMKSGIKGFDPVSNLLVKVNNNGQPLFISAINYPTESLELTGSRNDIWMVSAKNVLPLNILENNNTINYKADINLTPEKASVNGQFILHGGFIPVMDEISTENHIKDLVSSHGKTISTTLNKTTPRNVDVNFSCEKELSSTHNYLLYQLPTVKKGVASWYMNSLNSSRKNQFELPYAVTESYNYTITLAPDMVLKTENKQTNIKKPFGALHISIAKNGNIVTVKKELQLTKVILSPSEYADFRNMINIWNDKNNNTLIINTK